MPILLTWLGNTDLRASESSAIDGLGPILSALRSLRFAEVHLLSDYSRQKTVAYAKCLSEQGQIPVKLHLVNLTSPTNFEEIFRASDSAIQEIREGSPSSKLTYHLSPETPAMAAVWILLAKTRYPAALIESSRELGVRKVAIPFELAAEFFPGMDKHADDALTRLMQGMPPETPAFTAIIHRCAAMKRTVAMAHRLALRDVPVLIQGESGTGKELFARAMHQASSRNAKPFVAVNCGAIPPELVDAELFGHEKGAFTGAVSARTTMAPTGIRRQAG